MLLIQIEITWSEAERLQNVWRQRMPMDYSEIIYEVKEDECKKESKQTHPKIIEDR